MSWLSGLWDRNRGAIGNAVKNVAPALAFVPGLGLVAAGAAGAVGRAIQPGANFGDILKSGVSSAGIGGGARGLYSAAQGALSAAGGGGGAGASAAGGAGLPDAATELPKHITDALSGAPPGYQLTPSSAGGAAASAGPVANIAASAAPSASSGWGGAAKAAGSFLKDNAGALGQAGAGVLNARQQGAELDFQKQQYADEQERRRRLAELMAPLYQQLQASQQGIAPNPYTPRH